MESSKPFFSIITPTHNPKHLLRLYVSIKSQLFHNFEWVVVPNNNAGVSFLPPEPWLRVIPYPEGAPALIGAIKNFAFKQGRGEWLVEADHDDELLPNCLQLLAEATQSGTDFIYSDCIELLPDGTTKNYGGGGWSHYEYLHRGKNVLINRAFAPTPQAVSRIWFAPNHVRAWKTEFYNKIGGHDATLRALDDQDLLCRTFIEGNMLLIQQPLYVYHFHEHNSYASSELNTWIQINTMVLYEKYIYAMMERWADKNGLLKVDLCGGHNPPPGYISIDIERSSVIHDLNTTPWPIGNNSVGVVRAHDALEHLKSPINTMKEIHRILAPGGMLLSMTPSTDGRGAFQDPTHVSFWNSNSFWYYCKKEIAAYINTPVRFQSTFVKNAYPSDWHREHRIEYVYAHLTALKGGDEDNYAPGGIQI